MGYVENNLSKNENILYQGKIHWFIFVPPLMMMLLAFFVLADDSKQDNERLVALVVMAFCVFVLVHSFFYKISSEFAITNRRIISKTGFISRKTVEFNHGKIESINVEQSIFGRIFGYGSVVINGTGGAKTPVKNIAKPLKFRMEAMNVIDHEQEQAPVLNQEQRQ